MRGIGLHESYVANSPYYAELTRRYGSSIGYDAAIKECRKHGIDIQELFDTKALEMSDVVGGTRVDVLALVMALGY